MPGDGQPEALFAIVLDYLSRVRSPMHAQGSCVRLLPAPAMETSEECLVHRYLRIEAEEAASDAPGVTETIAHAGHYAQRGPSPTLEDWS